MAWIDEIRQNAATDDLAAVYDAIIDWRGRISNLFSVQSLNPDALHEHLDLYVTLMFGESGLSRAEREAVAIVVSASNDCEYCVRQHREALSRYEQDEEVLNLLSSADGLETFEPRLSNIVRHAYKLTNAPEAMTESDLGELRAVGLDDRDILDLTLVTAYYNFANRIALGLGVDFGDEEAGGYRDDQAPGG